MDVDTSTKLSVAAEAEADPRSVTKEIERPGSVRGRAGERIRRVLLTRGIRNSKTAAALASGQGATR